MSPRTARLADFIKIEELKRLLLVKLISHCIAGWWCLCTPWGGFRGPQEGGSGLGGPRSPILPRRLPGAAVHISLVFSVPQGPLLKGKRCVVLADGFYEWQQHSGGKQPYFIYFPQSKDAVVWSLNTLSPCSLQLPGEKPLSLQLCPSLGSLFPNRAPSRGGLSTPASLCCKPCGPQAVNAAAASPPSRSLLPACRIFAWVGDRSHRGLGWGFRYLFPSAEPAVGLFGGEGGCWLAWGKMKLLVSLLELPQSSRKAPGKSPDQFMT